VKTLEQAIAQVAALPDADQEQIGRRLLSHVEKLRRLREELDKGTRSPRGRARHSTSKNSSVKRPGSMAGRRGAAIWSPEALVDVDEIWNYYERVAGRKTAQKILREIGEVVATVEDHPFAGRIGSRVNGLCYQYSSAR
jgi:hypothetical protein